MTKSDASFWRNLADIRMQSLHVAYRELEDARLMVTAMSKYRFAMFPAWSDSEEGLSSSVWCVAGHTCRDDGHGIPVLSNEARRGLKDLLMVDVPDHPKPGFWRRVFMRLAR